MDRPHLWELVLIHGGSSPARSDKPWGSEVVWARGEGYAAKLLHIEPGHRLSLQHHERKEETLLVLQGRVTAEIEDDQGELRRIALDPGEGLHVPPGRRHRLESEGGALLVEVSSAELQDVVRHADDYGRADLRDPEPARAAGVGLPEAARVAGPGGASEPARAAGAGLGACEPARAAGAGLGASEPAGVAGAGYGSVRGRAKRRLGG